MFHSIHVPHIRLTPQLSRVLSVATMPWNAWLKRREERETVQHLRQFDHHMTRDIDLDREALWQPRPEIRRLHSGFLAAAGCREERY